ncbi:dihydrodipicolinate synthase family protein [Sediminicola luteus]|uniref:N-acetylneuraminate lyase n=1 Tax=Sediminicola luteus TaxID=319238 RepID=A0A2A4G3N7_9FLAO|nr:dihydrodipicolinate synthase family protein [Sediminicola luteus]PCE63033.1 N-acetylneuraminate lyase [Sediminicola luteus]
MPNLIAATYAPLQSNGTLQLNGIEYYTKYLTHNRIKGVFVNGSTGDFVSLSIQERKELLTAWHQNKPNGFQIINHVGHTSLPLAQELAAHSIGKADAISALAPYYYPITNNNLLIQYCKSIAEAAPELPFYYYHIPVLSKIQIDIVAFMKRAKTEIPNFAGLKFTENNLMGFTHCLHNSTDNQNIMFGVDEMFLPSLGSGAHSWVGSTYNQIAPLYQAIANSFTVGQHQKAASLQQKAIRFVEILVAYGSFLGVAKGLLDYLGLPLGPSRFPHTNLTTNVYSKIMRTLENEGIAPYLGNLP